MDTSSWLHHSSLSRVIQRTVGQIYGHQGQDGRFSYLCETSPWSNAMAIIALYVCGERRDPLIPLLARRLRDDQRSSGGWSLYDDQDFHLSCSVLSYFALLLAGAQRESTFMQKAESMILRHGGLLKASSLAKAFLAAAGQVPWSSFPAPPIRLILQKPNSLLSLYDFSVPMRVHMPSVMILSTMNFTVPVPESCSLRHLLAQRDFVDEQRVAEPHEAAIKACETFLLERLEVDGTIASYLSATALFAFSRLAISKSTKDEPFQRALAGMGGLVYEGKPSHGGIDVDYQMFPSDVWDTSLAMQALSAAGVVWNHPRMLMAAQYLLSRQHHRTSDWVYHAPGAKAGGWAFSHGNLRYPDLDDTAAALKALRPLWKRGMMTSQWSRGVNWLRAMQNDDGGFAAFEKNVNKRLLNLLARSDLPESTIDPSSPDVTGSALDVLVRSHKLPHDAGKKAVTWLLSQQLGNGAWRGRWGVRYLYGTFQSAKGLRAAGIRGDHPAMLRARAWLEDVQNPDGGFGESCRSDQQAQYVALGYSLPSQTAWGLLGLMATSQGMTLGIHKAAQWLIQANGHHGWHETYPTGVGVAGEMYIRYHSYAQIWPLLALGTYRKRLRQST